ncbi:MAG: ribosomal protein small subunit ribosomal protein [Patescibacteria group bacterium]|nr:ribosomal protein small subunit ribosomal protein [Patescibacteria group bacterium]
MGSEYREQLRADVMIRDYLEKSLRSNYIADVEFERSQKSTRIIISTSRPGMVIGRQGEGAAKLKANIVSFMKSKNITVPEDLKIDVLEVTNPDANAKIVAISIAEQLEKRMTFRRVMKMTLEKIMQARGVKGAKIVLSGRLGGADMSRKEELKLGGIPLQFMRGDVDYGTDTARMSYGGIGIKVWIYKGDTLVRATK